MNCKGCLPNVVKFVSVNHLTPCLPAFLWCARLNVQVSYAGLYGVLVFLPVTGLLMGYFSGKGVPFFNLFTIPGAEKPNGAVAKRAFKARYCCGVVVGICALASGLDKWYSQYTISSLTQHFAVCLSDLWTWLDRHTHLWAVS